jgi:hypothetical protein
MLILIFHTFHNIRALQEQQTCTTYSQCVNTGQCREVWRKGDCKGSVYLIMAKYAETCSTAPRARYYVRGTCAALLFT